MARWQDGVALAGRAPDGSELASIRPEAASRCPEPAVRGGADTEHP